MNLRLDGQSIRVRVSSEEALKLLESGQLEEPLALFDSPLTLSIANPMTTTESLQFECLEGEGPCLRIQASEVQRLLNALSAGEKKSSQLEVCRQVEIQQHTFEVSFQVDRFSSGPGH